MKYTKPIRVVNENGKEEFNYEHVMPFCAFIIEEESELLKRWFVDYFSTSEEWFIKGQVIVFYYEDKSFYRYLNKEQFYYHFGQNPWSESLMIDWLKFNSYIDYPLPGTAGSEQVLTLIFRPNWMESKIFTEIYPMIESQNKKLEKLPMLPIKSRTIGGGAKYDYSHVAPFHAVLVRQNSDIIKDWFYRTFKGYYNNWFTTMEVFVYWYEQNIYTSYTIEEFKDKFGIEPLKESAFEEILQQNNFFDTGNTGMGSTGEKGLSGTSGPQVTAGIAGTATPIEEKAAEKNETQWIGTRGTVGEIAAEKNNASSPMMSPNTNFDTTRASSEGRIYEKEKFLPTLEQLKSTGFAVIADEKNSPAHNWFNITKADIGSKTPFSWTKGRVYVYTSRDGLYSYSTIDTFLCSNSDAYVLKDAEFSTVLEREEKAVAQVFNKPLVPEECFPLPTLESLKQSGVAVIASVKDSPSHEWFNEKCKLNRPSFYDWRPGWVYVCIPSGKTRAYISEEVFKTDCILNLPILSDEEFTRVLKNVEPKGFYTGLPSSLNGPFAVIANSKESVAHIWFKQNYNSSNFDWNKRWYKGFAYIFDNGKVSVAEITNYKGKAMPLCSEAAFENFVTLQELPSKVKSLRENTPKNLKNLMEDIEFLAKNTDNPKYIKNYGLAYDKILEARGWLLQNKYN